MYDIKSGNPRDVNNSQEKKQAVKWMSFYQMKGATKVWLDEPFSLDNGLTMMSNFFAGYWFNYVLEPTRILEQKVRSMRLKSKCQI